MAEEELDQELPQQENGTLSETQGRLEDSSSQKAGDNEMHNLSTTETGSCNNNNNNTCKTSPDQSTDKRLEQDIQTKETVSKDSVEKPDVNTVSQNTETIEYNTNSTDISKCLKPGKLKNLADLITVCRDGGIQVFNDQPNIPEKEKQRIEELKNLGIDPRDEKKHTSDHLDPTDPKAIRKANKRKRVSNIKPLADVIIVCRNEGKQLYNDTINVPESDLINTVESEKRARHDMASGSRSSRSRRTAGTRTSRPNSFLSTSGMSSSVDLPEGDITSDEWLQQRMRRRSKRRKENKDSLIDLIRQKQEEIERLSLHSGAKYEHRSNVESNTDSIKRAASPKASSEISAVLHANDATLVDFGGAEKNHLKESRTHQDPRGPDENDHEINNTMTQNIPTSQGQDISQGLKENEPDLSVLTHESGLDDVVKHKNSTEINKDIGSKIHLTAAADDTYTPEKEQIYVDGDEKKNNQADVHIDESNNQTSDKTHTEESKYKTPSNEVPQVSEIEKNKQNHNSRQLQTSTLGNSNTANDAQPQENIIEEVRIKDGNSTLVLYKVKEKSTIGETDNQHMNGIEHDDRLPCDEKLEDKQSSEHDDRLPCDQEMEDKQSLHKDNVGVISPGTLVNPISNGPLSEPERGYGTDVKQRENSSGLVTYQQIDTLETSNVNDGLKNDECIDSSRNIYDTRRAESKGEDCVGQDTNINTQSEGVSTSDQNQSLNAGNISKEEICHQIKNNEVPTDYNTLKTNKGKIQENNSINKQNNLHTKLSGNDFKEHLAGNENYEEVNIGESIRSDMKSESDKGRILISNNGNHVNKQVGAKNDSSKVTHGGVNRDSNKMAQKPKRSLGNGFLVSSDTETDDDNSKSSKTINQKVNMDVARSDASSTASSKTTKKTSRTASSTPSSFKSMSSEARIVLIMEKLKQQHNEQISLQTSYLSTINETRKSLKDDYKKFRSGVDEDTLPTDHPHTVNDENDEVVMPERPYNILSGTDANEVKKQNHVDQQTSKEENDIANDAEHGMREQKVIETDPNADVVKTIKKNASTRLDNKWSKNDPVYQKIKSGFKSESKIPNTMNVQRELTRLKKMQFSTGHIPETSVYVQEAKRMYPKGFDSVRTNHDKPVVENRSLEEQNERKNNLQHSNDTVHKAPVRETKTDRQELISKIPVHAKRNSDTVNPSVENRQPNKKNSSEYPVHSSPYKSRGSKTKPGQVNDVGVDKLKRDRKYVEQYQKSVTQAIETYDVTNKPKHQSVDSRRIRNGYGNKSQSLDRTSTIGFQTKPNSVKAENKITKSSSLDGKGFRDKVVRTNGGLPGDKSEKGSPGKRDEHGLHGLSDASTSSMQSGKESIGAAVDIVQSRNKFYANTDDNLQEKVTQREHRVMTLFKEIQMIRKVTDTFDKPRDTYGDPASGFLWVNYDLSRNRKISSQRSDADLNKFLYERTNYELCTKVKNVNSSWNVNSSTGYKRKDRALDALRQKIFTKV